MDKVFPDGLYARKPNEKAPSFVKAELQIENKVLIEFLQKQPNEKTNITLKEAKSGSYYCEVNTWTPKDSRPEFMKDKPIKKEKEDTIEYPADEINPNDIPF